MPKTRNLSIQERAQVVTLSEEGYSLRAIARKLLISICAVQGIIRKVMETGSVKDRSRSGSPSSTTPRQNRLLSHLSLSDRRSTSKILKKQFQDATGVGIATRTVRWKLFKAGLRGCVVAKKPLLTVSHKERRVAWCEDRIGQENNGDRCCSQMSQHFS